MLSIVVLPTIALAIDQEQQLKKYVQNLRRILESIILDLVKRSEKIKEKFKEFKVYGDFHFP